MLRISVIIPCFNCADALRQTLLALAEQTVSPEEFKVIVVDDGSTDRSAEVATSLCLPYPFRLLRQANRGPGAARNRGARQAQADLLVFLDADMIPAPDLLPRYLAAHDSHSQAILIGRQLPWPEAFTSPFDRVLNYVSARDPGPRVVEAEWYYMDSGNFAIGGQAFEALGGFDEQLRMTEDTDLAYRAYRQGLEIRYHPAAVGYHNHPKTLEQLCCYICSSAWWTAQLMDKHPTIRGQLPIYRDVEPTRFRSDSVRLVARKLVRQLLAKPMPLAALETIVGALERVAPHPSLLEFLYWKILTSYRLIGFREGLESLRQQATTGDVEPRPKEVVASG